MQINGTTLSKRQKTLVRVAVLREHERATTAILALTDEITTLMNLINEDQENPNA